MNIFPLLQTHSGINSHIAANPAKRIRAAGLAMMRASYTGSLRAMAYARIRDNASGVSG
jgi:hypothetical protein